MTESNFRSLWIQSLLWFSVQTLDGVKIEQFGKGIAPGVWVVDKGKEEEGLQMGGGVVRWDIFGKFY